MNKNKNKQAKSKKTSHPPPTQRSKKSTPFSDAGAIVGSKLGTMFNAPYLKGVGKWLGNGIGQIFGSGDYDIMGTQPKYNVLMNGNQVPKFEAGNGTNVVCHREYIGDITGATAFTNRSYPLNPGMVAAFPWLSTVAQNYQQYRFHGIIFEFRPLITDYVTSGAPGVVIMATNYNADDAAYTSRQQLENSEFAVSVKPTVGMIHGIECALGQNVLDRFFVRTGSLASNKDLNFTDLGNFQFASQSNPAQALGELWVSYCVEFFKPKLPIDIGGTVWSYFFERSSTAAGSSPLGTTVVSSRGNLPNAANTATTISFTGVVGNYYILNIFYSGTVAGNIVYPLIVGTNATFPSSQFSGGGNSSIYAPPVTTPVLVADQTLILQCTTASAVVLTFGVAGTLPTGTTGVQCNLTEWSSSAVN